MKKKSEKKTSPAADLFGGALPEVPAKKTDSPLLAFSYSKMSLYEECPLKYKFRYIDKIKEEPKTFFAFGNSVHKALEFLYSVKAPPFPSLEEFLDAFRIDWGLKSYLEKGYKDPLKEEQDFIKGRDMLRNYYLHNKDKFRPPFLLEYSTDVPVDGLKVRIIADKIEYAGNGAITLVDYKTGADVKRAPAQLHMYQKICELDPGLREKIAMTYGQRVSSVRIESMMYYHVPTLKEYRFERAGDAEIGAFWERVLDVADRIRGLKFDATPGERQCKWCDYKNLCPNFYGARPSAAQALAEPPDQVEELVDRYGHLKERIDELNAQLKEVADKLDSASGGKGELSGSKYSLERKQSEKWEFSDREAVISALNEFGIYEKALALTLKNIVSLMNDPSVPEAARQKLKGQARKKTIVDFNLKKRLGGA